MPENGDLAALGAAIPALAGRLGPKACTEARARAMGAVAVRAFGGHAIGIRDAIGPVRMSVGIAYLVAHHRAG